MKQEKNTIEKKSNGLYRYDCGYQSLHFNLKQQKEKLKLTQIMLVVTIGGNRYRVYTKQKVEPAFWDKSLGCCKCSELLAKRVKNRMEDVNLILNRIKKDIEVADMRAAEHGSYLTREDLYSIVRGDSREPDDKRRKKSRSDMRGASPLSVLKDIADNFESQISSKGEKGASSSRKTYLYCCRRLEDFISETHIELNDFSQLDKSFYNKFAKWLNDRRFFSAGKWKRYTASTVQNTLGGISNLHHKAYETGLCQLPESRGSICRYSKETEHGKIYLNEAELKQIMDLSALGVKESEVRDMFVLSAYTGLRISDINNLNSAVITDGSIRLFQKKTHGYVAIPILKEASHIIDKYLGSPDGFPSIDPGMANRAVKSICRKAGIDTITPVNEYRGGEVLTRNCPKYELVSFHTARRSCITNLFRRGYSPNYLMLMSGHKSLSSFQRYIRTNNEELAEDFIKELRKKKAI